MSASDLAHDGARHLEPIKGFAIEVFEEQGFLLIIKNRQDVRPA